MLLLRDDQPENEVRDESRQPSREQQDEKENPKPEGADSEEGSETTTNPGNDSVLTAQPV